MSKITPTTTIVFIISFIILYYYYYPLSLILFYVSSAIIISTENTLSRKAYLIENTFVCTLPMIDITDDGWRHDRYAPTQIPTLPYPTLSYPISYTIIYFLPLLHSLSHSHVYLLLFLIFSSLYKIDGQTSTNLVIPWDTLSMGELGLRLGV